MSISVLTVTRYQCPVCKVLYESERAARKCLARGWNPLFQPGDIVVDVRAECLCMDDFTRKGIYTDPSSRYTDEPFCCIGGVYQENDPWVYLHGRHLHGAPGISPYWVVGAVTNDWETNRHTPTDAHNPVYHLFTEAGCVEGDFLSGWTCANHIVVKKPAVNPPPTLVEQAKKYIGRRAGFLTRTA